MKLTPEDLEKLETKKLANIIRKLNSGKTPTAREEAILAQARVGGAGDAASSYAKTWDELAQRLGVSRKALQLWRRDPRYSPNLPPMLSGERHDVVAWAAFMVRHGLARADERAAEPHISGHDEDAAFVRVPKLEGSQSDWQKVKIYKDVERRDLELDQLRNTLLVAAELEVPLGATLLAVQNKLAQFPERAGPAVAGFTDVQEVIAILRAEIESDLTSLHAAEYLEDLAQIVASLPIILDDTRALVLAAATETLRRIGQRALTGLRRAEVSTATSTACADDAAPPAAPASAPQTAPASTGEKVAAKAAPSVPGKKRSKKKKTSRP